MTLQLIANKSVTQIRIWQTRPNKSYKCSRAKTAGELSERYPSPPHKKKN